MHVCDPVPTSPCTVDMYMLHVHSCVYEERHAVMSAWSSGFPKSPGRRDCRAESDERTRDRTWRTPAGVLRGFPRRSVRKRPLRGSRSQSALPSREPQCFARSSDGEGYGVRTRGAFSGPADLWPTRSAPGGLLAPLPGREVRPGAREPPRSLRRRLPGASLKQMLHGIGIARFGSSATVISTFRYI